MLRPQITEDKKWTGWHILRSDSIGLNTKKDIRRQKDHSEDQKKKKIDTWIEARSPTAWS